MTRIASIAPLGAGSPPAPVRGAMRQASGDPVRGTADGPALVLPSGLTVQRRRFGQLRVTDAELAVVVQALQRLPVAHQRLVAGMKVPVELLPLAALEGGIIGSTELRQQADGSWKPWLVRIVTRSGREGVHHPAEVSQHEVGHVVGMATRRDDSEAFADAYARTY